MHDCPQAQHAYSLAAKPAAAAVAAAAVAKGFLMQAQDPRTPTRTPNQTPGRAAAASSVPRSGNVAALSAALQGATLAFQAGSGQKPPSDRKTDPISPSPAWLRVQSPIENGAVQAAARAASQAAREHSLSRSRSPTGRQDVSRHGTGSSVQESGVYNKDRERGLGRDVESGLGLETSPRPSLLSVANSPSMLSPGARPGTDGKQASFIAATLAASRSGSPSPNHTGQSPAQMPLTPTQLHSRVSRRESLATEYLPSFSPVHDIPQLTDTTPIPPANSLISLFESKKDDMDPVKKSDHVPRPQRSSIYPKVHPPTPPRSHTPEIEVREKPKPKPKPKPASIAEGAVIGAPGPFISGGAVNSEDRSVSQPGLLRVPVTRRQATRQEDSGSESQASEKPLRLTPRQSQFEVDDKLGRVSEPSVPGPWSLGPELTSSQLKKILEKPSGNAQLPPTRRPTNAGARKPESPNNREVPRDTKMNPTLSDYTSGIEEKGIRRLSQVSTSSADTFVSASSTQSPHAMSPVKDIDSGSRGGRHSPSRGPALPPRVNSANNSTQNLPLDSLTDAIMAGNLASARLTSASVAKSQTAPPPLPGPRRHGVHRSHNPLHKLQQQLTGDSTQSSYNHHRNMGSRSPQRTGMLQTLRAPVASKSDDEDARRHMQKHRKKKLTGMRKHAHQEGSRRRWRDEITTRERRRYEAVWASNRGLFLRPGFAFQHPETSRRASPSPLQRSTTIEGGGRLDEDTAMLRQIEQSRAQDGSPEADYVVNIVVRDLWSRSRLPPDELAEVWDLVDREKQGALGKQEFVVGMWLIDQRLRGRKIPARVSESVWESARGMGMKVMPVPVPRDSRGRRERSS